MLTEQGFKIVLDRMQNEHWHRSVAEGKAERLQRDVDQLVDERDKAVLRATDAEGELGRVLTKNEALLSERDAAQSYAQRLEGYLAHARATAAQFPFPFEPTSNIHIAFASRLALVESMQDDEGAWAFGGDFEDLPQLRGAVINPRTYLTCSRLNLIRFGSEPVGKVQLDDDLPF